jgi:hypothetical protein
MTMRSIIKTSRGVWLPSLLIASCGIIGYAAGSARGSSGSTPDESAEPAPRERQAARPARAAFDAAAGFGGLLSAGGRETDVWKVVSRLPQAGLDGFREQVREKMASAPNGSAEFRRLEQIESALYFRWAEIDPTAALADVSTIPKSLDFQIDARRTNLLKSVLAAWMRTDADAAYSAVKNHRDFGYTGRDMFVQTWTPENVFENANRYPDKYRDLLGWYCVAAAEKEQHRNAMLAALESQPDLKDGETAKFMLFRSWGYRDFNAAIEEAKARGYEDRVKQIVEDNLGMTPHLALPWAAANDHRPGGTAWEDGYRNWLVIGPDQARGWLSGQLPAWKAAGHMNAVAGLLAADYLLSHDVRGLPSHDKTARQLIEAVSHWRSTDPQAAGEWLDTAPAAVREMIGREGVGHE